MRIGDLQEVNESAESIENQESPQSEKGKPNPINNNKSGTKCNDEE